MSIRARGIDTSHYNGDITHAVSQSDFVISQCTVGTWIDTAYAGDQAIARSQGKLAAAYHYAVYGPGPTRQAQVFLAHAGNADWLMVDAEQRGSNRLLNHPDTITAIIVNIRRLDPLHRKITLYSSRATTVNDKGVQRSIWKAVTAQDANHVADYGGDPNRSGAQPPVPWSFWQYSGTGIDRDWYAGTLAQLKAWV